MTRRILQLDGAKLSVSTESRFASERDLHDAVAAHPEVLPSEDIGLGPLVALGTELGFGAGPLDLLAADPQGRLVIVEFKRGTENPDVRKVVAQVLDYGASLWRTSYDEVGRRCAGAGRSLRLLTSQPLRRLDARCSTCPSIRTHSGPVSRRCLIAGSSCFSTSAGISMSELGES